MNKKIYLVLLALAGVSLLAGEVVQTTGAPALPLSAVPPKCCAVEKKAAACCAAESENGPAAALSNRSLYLVDSSWTDDRGASVHLKTLRGHAVIVAMFFAQCEYACPMTISDIQRTLAALPPAAREKTRVLLVTFDPDRDTSAALKAYRDRASLDSSWTLLRGEAGEVQELAMLLGVKYKRDARGQFSHSNLITVLSREGEIVFQRAGLQGDVSELAKAVGSAVE